MHPRRAGEDVLPPDAVLFQRVVQRRAKRLPRPRQPGHDGADRNAHHIGELAIAQTFQLAQHDQDRKSTRLNSSHLGISYAVFCLKKKNKNTNKKNISKNMPTTIQHQARTQNESTETQNTGGITKTARSSASTCRLWLAAKPTTNF